MDYYAVLDVEPSCTDDELKAQYRRLARLNHPDVNHDDREGSTERLRVINEAYGVLSDPRKRRRYDVQQFGASIVAPDTVDKPAASNVPPPNPVYADAYLRSMRTSRSQMESRYGLYFIGLLILMGFAFLRMQHDNQVAADAERARTVATLSREVNALQPQILLAVRAGNGLKTLVENEDGVDTPKAKYLRYWDSIVQNDITYLLEEDREAMDTVKSDATSDSPINIARSRYVVDQLRAQLDTVSKDMQSENAGAGQTPPSFKMAQPEVKLVDP